VQFASVGEGVVSEDVGGAPQLGALGVLVGAQLGLVGPARELAMRGEPQCYDLIA